MIYFLIFGHVKSHVVLIFNGIIPASCEGIHAGVG
jgi:hypothetical protein